MKKKRKINILMLIGASLLVIATLISFADPDISGIRWYPFIFVLLSVTAIFIVALLNKRMLHIISLIFSTSFLIWISPDLIDVLSVHLDSYIPRHESIPIVFIIPFIYTAGCLVVIIASLIALFKKSSRPGATRNVADELLKLNNLKEQGIITPEEFEGQKKKLLS